MTKKIPLTQGKYATVDDDVYEWASRHKWYAHRSGKTFYAVRNVGKYPHQRHLHLHREIMNPHDGTLVDHADGDGLNCTRANMRLASQAENTRNRGRNINNTSGFKGVYWRGERGKWYAKIMVNGKFVYLGSSSRLEDAARIYDVAAIKYFGEFAKTNF